MLVSCLQIVFRLSSLSSLGPGFLSEIAVCQFALRNRTTAALAALALPAIAIVDRTTLSKATVETNVKEARIWLQN